MERKQFTFYSSFYKTVQRIRSKTVRADVYDAICGYALNETMPDLEKMPPAAAIAFEAAKPVLDASRRKAEGAAQNMAVRMGAEAPQDGQDAVRIPSGYGQDTVSKGEKEIEIEVETEDKTDKNKCSFKKPPYGGGGRRKKEQVPYGSAGTAPLGELEQQALERMLREAGERNA